MFMSKIRSRTVVKPAKMAMIAEANPAAVVNPSFLASTRSLLASPCNLDKIKVLFPFSAS